MFDVFYRAVIAYNIPKTSAYYITVVTKPITKFQVTFAEDTTPETIIN